MAQTGDDAKVAELKAAAQKAIEAGELAKADALLAEVETEQARAQQARGRFGNAYRANVGHRALF